MAWVASFAVLFAGVTNAHAHVHLCFDGQEPPTSVRLSDASHHHDERRAAHAADAHGHHADDADHDDLDLDLSHPALAKTVKHDVNPIAPAWLKDAAIAPRKIAAPALEAEKAPPEFRHYLHPPLRAPPH